MAGYRRKNHKRKTGLWGILFSLLACCFFVLVALWIAGRLQAMEGVYDASAKQELSGSDSAGEKPIYTVSGNTQDTAGQDAVWEVHCIDVGQASATLVIAGDYTMLADAGNRDDAGLILEYLAEQGVTELDYLVLTHPHEDHIGSAANILREIPVNRVLMPDISIDMCETVCYADLLAALEEKEPLIDYPKAGDNYEMGILSFKVVCPSPEWVTDAEDINESSLGIRISDGKRHILLYGDGKQYCENYMTEYQEIEADILIVGHHGSTYSSSEAFLEAVKPQYAVISCGKDNDYGFPHPSVLRRLEAIGANILRTDEMGTIVFSFDGKNLTF